MRISGLLCLTVLLAATSCSTAAEPPAPAATDVAVTTSATPTAAPENERPGTADWKITKRGEPDEIEGYADHVSVRPGEAFRLYVSTTRASFRAEAFRIGWYGGRGARLVWESGATAGARQPAAKIDPATYTVKAPWKPSLDVQATDWPEGSYLIRLTASGGAQRYVPITVRSAETSGRLVIVNATTTWQAYNKWGGHNLYGGPAGFSDRSRAVSFDRPYDTDGAKLFRSFEQDAIILAEKQGLPLAYTTDNDLHSDAALLTGASGLITLGHDEYWSTAMWKNVQRARDAGTNLAFLGANAVNRHIRYEPTELGADRLVVCYKSLDDPIGRTDPSEVTVDWRIGSPPRPESALIGIQYNCFPADGEFTVIRPRHWLFDGTGVKKGQAFPGLIGPETDALNLGGPTPRPIEIVADSPVRGCPGVYRSQAVYYTAKSGAGVFSTGTMRFVCGLRGSGCGHGVTDEARPFVARVIENVLTVFAAGPAGLTHPARDNLKDFG
ncbi:hypothetical protein GCM10027589_31210 [Actinocorallia lasiicapitis]